MEKKSKFNIWTICELTFVLKDPEVFDKLYEDIEYNLNEYLKLKKIAEIDEKIENYIELWINIYYNYLS